ncbi:MAG: histidine ammonia-lyase [Anaerolineae bacterium]|nr:histidine ammonia-lyase [Anaerolineae bacterium]
MTILLNGENLSIEDIVAIAREQEHVELTDAAWAGVERSRAAVDALLDSGAVVYGITTGFGDFKSILINRADTATLQRNLVRSHAVGVGPTLPTEAVRALMAVRANTLAKGYSGVQPTTLRRLLDLLNHGVHPVVPSRGSLGASGDLAPLAHIALTLIGEGEAEWGGETLPSAEALARADLQPVTLGAKEGLALVNGTALMGGLGALIVHGAELVYRTANIAGALSLEALEGSAQAFDPRLQAVRPHPRQVECAAHLRTLLEGSGLVRQLHDPHRVQDAYSLRCMPQVHGAVHDAVAYARWVMDIENNSATDNPLLFWEGDTPIALSGGNFHGELTALALDYLKIGLTELGNISERRINRLVDPHSNGGLLPPFLTEHGGLNTGFMLAHYTAAALASENKTLAHPASADTIPTSGNTEDHVSMGPTAAHHALMVLDNAQGILAIELLCAAQAVDFRRRGRLANAALGQGTTSAYDLIRQSVPFLAEDAYLAPLIAQVKGLVVSGEIAMRA